VLQASATGGNAASQALPRPQTPLNQSLIAAADRGPNILDSSAGLLECDAGAVVTARLRASPCPKIRSVEKRRECEMQNKVGSGRNDVAETAGSAKTSSLVEMCGDS
jgi:hypothetical protein